MTPERRKVFVGARAIDVEVYRPDGPGPWPGVLLLHELFGLTDHVRADAADLAGHGYLTWAPDLYTDGARARYCIRMFFTPEGLGNRAGPLVGEVQALLDTLKADPDVRSPARHDRHVHDRRLRPAHGPARRPRRAGRLPPRHRRRRRRHRARPTPPRIRGPVQGHFAEKDFICPRRRVDKLPQLLGDRLDLRWHDGVGHGLRSRFRSTPAGAEAWTQTLDFLARHLRDAPAAGV